jgi:hypothetical protein
MTEDLYRQAMEDYLRAKARKEQTGTAVLRAHAEDDEAQAELDRMQNVLDWMEPHRPQECDEPQERTATPAPARPRRSTRKPTRARKTKTENLSDLVEGAVRQIGGLVKNGEILDHLERGGHHYTPLQIRGSAKHLAAKGRLVSGGYGIWALPETAPQPESALQLDFAPTVPVAGADTASTNGHVPAGAH